MSQHGFIPPLTMTSADFLPWAETQQGRFELSAGEVLAMAPEPAIHNIVKSLAWSALRRAVKQAGAPCHVMADGMTVVIDDRSVYEPDALVYCGPRIHNAEMRVATPVILVEVTSPSSGWLDHSRKLIGYFQLPSVMHYLIVEPDVRRVVHHRRLPDGDLLTRILATGPIPLDPPGITIQVEELFED